MRVLLDTHAFLWWLGDSSQLSGRARQLIGDETNRVSISAATAWEIATKHRIGKLRGCEAVALDIAGHIAAQGFDELPIMVADAEHAGRLPGPHRDPFDRMLAAQALARGLPIISADGVFDRYGLNRLW